MRHLISANRCRLYSDNIVVNGFSFLSTLWYVACNPERCADVDVGPLP